MAAHSVEAAPRAWPPQPEWSLTQTATAWNIPLPATANAERSTLPLLRRPTYAHGARVRTRACTCRVRRPPSPSNARLSVSSVPRGTWPCDASGAAEGGAPRRKWRGRGHPSGSAWRAVWDVPWPTNMSSPRARTQRHHTPTFEAAANMGPGTAPRPGLPTSVDGVATDGHAPHPRRRPRSQLQHRVLSQQLSPKAGLTARAIISCVQVRKLGKAADVLCLGSSFL